MTNFPWQLVKALQDQQRQALEAQQQREREQAVEFIGKLIQQASAYTKGVVVAGYAAILAVWGFAKGWMPPIAHAMAGLLLIASVLTFVLWEVFANNITAANRFAELTDRLTSGDAAAALKEYAAETHRTDVKRARWARVVVIVTLVTALDAASVIAVCVVLALVKELRAVF